MLYLVIAMLFVACRTRQATRHMWSREDESELADLFEQYKDDSGE